MRLPTAYTLGSLHRARPSLICSTDSRPRPALPTSAYLASPPSAVQSSTTTTVPNSRPISHLPETPRPLARPSEHYLLAQPPSDQSLSSGLLDEAHRLNDQHYAYRRACNGHLLHPHLDLLSRHRFSKILDVGCGTGVWLRDIASSSLSMAGHPLQAHGCDLELRLIRTMMPLQTSTFSFFRHDITRTLSTPGAQRSNQVGASASYDLVHARLLIFALRKGERGWRTAVRNMASFLKPNGVLQLSDLNAVAHPHRFALAKQSPSIEALNTISRRALSFTGHDVNAGDHLASYLAGAGLRNITSERFRIPFGRAARDQGWCERDVLRADQTVMKAFVGLKRPFLAAGGDPSKAGITTAADFDAFLAQLEAEIRNEGMYLDFVMTYGQKAGK